MKKTKCNFFLLLFYFLGLFYLVLPEPVIPNLEPGFKSTEPGDTIQIPGVWAYYTNLSREESINFFEKRFKKSPFLGIPLITYKLNHPPEYARETIKDTLFSNFYEELVHPLRESLFISGWIPSEDEVYLKDKKDPITDFVIEGEHYNAKITLFHVQSSVFSRILVWTGINALIFLLINEALKIFKLPWKKK
ncbi:MAG: hypothetical protein ABIH88_00600 [Patescibacteria group bacterium]|nr:hypothetical protein [Patescibacteria group bacterium]